METKYTELTEKIIGAFYTVYNKLGYGFLEKVYENSMVLELAKQGCVVVQQMQIKVYYDRQVVGEYYADLVVDDSVIVELKATRDTLDDFEAQLLNYLKATRYEVGLLMNFGPRPRFVRRAFDNSRKGSLNWTTL